MSALNDAGPDLLAAIAAALGQGGLRVPEPRDLDEPRGHGVGRAAAVALPRTTEEVAAVVRACAAARVGIVPRAGGTGLVGGQVMAGGALPIILSVERLSAIRDIRPSEGALIAEAGVTLAAVKAAAGAAGMMFPLSLASEGTARIGGLLATNAGGVQVLRYGNARDLTLGIEAVLPDGRILRDLKTIRKDNTGYDLRHLLIGAEGTLGLITAASLRLFPAPREVATAWVAVADPQAACGLFTAVQAALGETISAFELVHGTGLSFLAAHFPAIRAPIATGDWFVLVEVAGAAGVGDALAEALATAQEGGLAQDAVLARSLAQAAAMWAVRETIPLANRKVGAVASHDISVPRDALPGFIATGIARLAAIDPGLRLNCFGHLGDGNLHYNVFPAPGQTRAAAAPLAGAVTDAVHALVREAGGSISAEHGIGRLKAAELAATGDPGKLFAMRAIKTALDPLGIFNPGAVLG